MFPVDWDLSYLLEGAAASSQEFHLYLDGIQRDLDNFSYEIPELFGPYQKISDALSEASGVVSCLSGENTSNAEATKLEARLNALNATLTKISLKIDEILLALSDEEFEKVATRSGVVRFAIAEKREKAKEMMSREKESLVTDLSVSGLHGLMTLYFTYMGEIEFDMEGKKLNLSQLENLFDDDDRSKRINSHNALEEELTKREAVFAQLLNNIVDIRLRIYQARGWDDFLHETLKENRTSKETLDAMWQAVSDNKGPLLNFMSAKASLMGLSHLNYADYGASIGNAGQTKIPYDKSCQSIITLFSNLSRVMGNFAKTALQNGWVSAAASERKRAGGFCVSLPLAKESRILMTYADSLRSQGTLAHELGHAFHNEAMKDLPHLLRRVPVNVCETASTMCEMMVHDNGIRQAKNNAEKLFLLDSKLTDYISFNMDLHSRFLFEKAFHERRTQGFVAPQEISQMMIEAQEEGFAGAFESYLPHFWAYKMHFFLTDAPFYNWTYTFGYLFSLGVYAHLKDSGNFEEKYIALLRDSGAMSVEELAKKHLGVDLTKSGFWQGAIDILNADIAEYIKLAKSVERQSV